MNTLELEFCLNQYDFLEKYSIGVFSSDRLPEIKKFPQCFIANTDPSNKPGQHWISVYFDEEGIPYFFDSYGMKPSGKFESYLKNFNKNIVINQERLQGPLSSTCGHYSLFYLFYFCINNNDKGYFKVFDENYHENDHKIVDIVDYYFNFKIPIFQKFTGLNQICVALGH